MTDADVPRPTPGEALRALMVKWRADAAFNPRETAHGYSFGLTKCADELEAALRLHGPAGGAPDAAPGKSASESTSTLSAALPPEERPKVDDASLPSAADVLGILAPYQEADGCHSAYSREEFERDRMGETGDRLRAEGRQEPEDQGKCHFCANEGILPSEAIACALHSEYAIRELKAEIAVLRNEAGASSRLHLALADLDGSVPSGNGQAELDSVRETRDRLERVRILLQHALDVASYDADVTSSAPSAAEGRSPTEPREHFCVRCHHHWTGDLVAEYCGDCHRASLAAEAIVVANLSVAPTEMPLLDRATLEAVHDYYEFTATTDREMDAWLHEQILRARKGRDLTPEERAMFIEPTVPPETPA